MKNNVVEDFQYIIKDISISSAPIMELYKDTLTVNMLEKMIRKYIDRMSFNNIKIPSWRIAHTEEDSVFFKQNFIDGMSAKKYIENSQSVYQIVDLFKLIYFDVVNLYHCCPDIAVDLNLENFIISSDGVFLIDYSPPIILPMVVKSESLLFKLFCDRQYHLYAMIYYFCKGIISNSVLSYKEKVTAILLLQESIVKSGESIKKGYPFDIFMTHVTDYLNKDDENIKNIVLKDSFTKVMMKGMSR